MNYLVVNKIFFSYDKKEIIKNINLVIDKGESISIFGPNGSGKTTLLKIILSILKPQKGEIFLEGKNVFKFKERERAKKIFICSSKSLLIFSYVNF